MKMNIFLSFIIFNINFINIKSIDIEKITNLKCTSAWNDLKQAIKKGDLENFISLLTSNQELINKQDKLGMTLLMIAVVENKKQFVMKLLNLGARTDLQNDFAQSQTALDLAKHYKHDNIIKILQDSLS